jgi:hypothetical protein
MARASHELAGVFHVFRPAIQKVALEGFPAADDRSHAVSWVHLAPLIHSNSKKTPIELIDPASGYKFSYQRGDRTIKKQGVSRLCKFAQWDLYIKSLTTRRMKIQDQDSSYRLSKYFAKDYRLVFKLLLSCFKIMLFRQKRHFSTLGKKWESVPGPVIPLYMSLTLTSHDERTMFS